MLRRGDLCYLGECVTPGRPATSRCARPSRSRTTCGDGFVCDPQQKLCLPSKADPTCQLRAAANVFKPEPLFTWGKRKVFPCAHGQRLSGRRGVLRKGVHADVEALGARGRRHADPLSVLVDPARRRPRRQLRAGHHLQHLQATTTAAERRDPCDPRRHRREAVDGDGPGLSQQQHLEPRGRRHRRRRPARGARGGEGKRIIAIKSDGTPLWKSDAVHWHRRQRVGGDRQHGRRRRPPEIIFGAAIFATPARSCTRAQPGIGLNGQGPISCMADLDGDGRPELVGGRTAYKTTGTVAATTSRARRCGTARHRRLLRHRRLRRRTGSPRSCSSPPARSTCSTARPA